MSKIRGGYLETALQRQKNRENQTEENLRVKRRRGRKGNKSGT